MATTDDLDEHIARLERILAKRVPVPDAAVRRAVRAKVKPERVKWIEALPVANATTVAEYISENLLPVLHELQDMCRRVSAIEDRGIKYCGVLSRFVDYKRGDVVTNDGSMWIATGNVTDVKPGTSNLWMMTTKSHGKAAGGKQAQPPVIAEKR